MLAGREPLGGQVVEIMQPRCLTLFDIVGSKCKNYEDLQALSERIDVDKKFKDDIVSKYSY